MPMITTPDGCRLHLDDGDAAAAAPPDGARGAVLIVHGLGEHGGRYDGLAAQLRRGGWAVQRYDQRGHGRSGGPRGGLPAGSSLLADLGLVLAWLQASRAGRGQSGPLVLLGHSMGGLVAGRYVAEGLQPRPAPWWQPVQTLVMSSPALDPGMNGAQRLLLELLGRLAPDLAVGNGLDPRWISRDPAVVQAYRTDPLVHRKISPRLVRFIVDEGRWLVSMAGRWTLPTLLMYAGADRCVAPGGSDEFAAAAPPAVLSTQRWDGLSHEIFNEPERAQVLRRLDQWLDARFPAPAAAPAS